MRENPVERRLAAILSADVVGFGRLVADDEVETARALREHRALVRSCVEARRGRIVDAVGDNALAEFASAVDAVGAALEVQAQVAARSDGTPEARRIRLRIGIDLGDVVVDGDRILGDGVNVAARLESIAPAGGIVLSGAAYEHVAGKLDLDAVDLGVPPLKNVARPVRAWALRLPGVEMPEPARPAARLRSPRTAFVGRDEARTELARLLGEHRLVTLTGLGGAGKTRLALQVADDVAGEFDASPFADLTPLRDGADIAPAIHRALGGDSEALAPGGARAEDAVVALVGDRHLLLLLDNCEHLVDDAADVADHLLARCRRLVVLATSREPLAIDGERIWRVAPMRVPNADVAFEAGRDAEAIRLFIDRATAARADFALTAEVYEPVRRICARLDGIPLAIELAAARVRHLGPEDIDERLDDRFRLLVASGRRTERRHRTLQDMLDWSHDLLGDEERILFRRLAVFAGPCTLEAAEAICGGPPLEAVEVFERLGALVDRSLLVADDGASGTRYRLLETVREYAGAKLAASDEGDEVQRRHRDWFAALVRPGPEDIGPALLFSTNDEFRGLTEEMPDIALAAARAVHDRAVEPAHVLAGAVAARLRAMARDAEAIEVLARALAIPGDDEPVLRVLNRHALAQSRSRAGDLRGGFEEEARVVREAERMGLTWLVAHALGRQASYALSTRQADPQLLAESALEAAVRSGEPVIEIVSRLGLAKILLHGRAFADAARVLERIDPAEVAATAGSHLPFELAGLHLFCALFAGDRARAKTAAAAAEAVPIPPTGLYLRAAWADLLGRPRIHYESVRGEHVRARQLLAEVIEAHLACPQPLHASDHVATAAAVFAAAGDHEDAARLLGAARAAMRKMGGAWGETSTSVIYVSTREQCTDALGADAVRRLIAEAGDADADSTLADVRRRLESSESGEPRGERDDEGECVFRRDGEYWTLAYDGGAIRLKDAKGLHHLAQLLAHPGREFHVLDLIATEAGAARDDRVAAQDAPGAALDEQAKRAYRRRLAELREELEEAEEWNDTGRAERARDEMERLTAQLAGAVGLGGRDRPQGADAERARATVTQRIKASIKKVGAEHAPLARYLTTNIKTGYFCAYDPDPSHPIAWEL